MRSITFLVVWLEPTLEELRFLVCEPEEFMCGIMAFPKPLEIVVEYISGIGFLGPEVKNPSFFSID